MKHQCYYHSPIGDILITSNETHLTGLYLPKDKRYFYSPTDTKASAVFKNIFHQLDDYFQGNGRSFSQEFLLIGTEFQKKTWQYLINIPYGQTVCYSQVAQHIHQPQATRAVAQAIGKNPLSLIIPCHRVIGKNGSMTGHAGGLDAKKFLLAREQDNMSQKNHSETYQSGCQFIANRKQFAPSEIQQTHLP